MRAELMRVLRGESAEPSTSEEVVTQNSGVRAMVGQLMTETPAGSTDSRGGVGGGVRAQGWDLSTMMRGLNGLELWPQSPRAAAENEVRSAEFIFSRAEDPRMWSPALTSGTIADDAAQNRAFHYFEEEFLGTLRLQNFNFIGESTDAER